MGAEREKPVWERIAELGFADAVESTGFRRVNATHWKMEGEGLTWRMRLVRGYKATPTSFLPVHGAFVHGLDELYARWDGSKASQYLHGGGQRVHMQSDTGMDVILAQKREFDRLHPPPPPLPGRGGWRGLLDEIFQPVRPDFEKEFLDIRYWGRAGNDLRAQAFLTEGHDLRDVAATIIGYWERYSWPWIEARLDFRNLYRFHWGPGTIPDIRHPDPFYYAVARLAGDQAHIERMADAAFAEARKSYEDVWKECEREGSFERSNVTSGEISRDQLAKNSQMLRQGRAYRLEKIGRALDIRLPPSGIDYTEFLAVIEQDRTR
ncbi:MAG: hypothetical protein TEF_21080 [Rhizobiales bacterium NRL2]|jgi:hypothetical protein|nr:MAG: hypothetical protein TEF_21080 [Rhizobiales bacterium NRL2]